MSDTEPALSQKLGAEVLGTFVLVFMGVGAAIASGGNYAATGLAFGISVLIMIYAVGHISGGHFNPAVSVGAAVGGRIAWLDAAYYIGAQLVGALLAGLVLFVTMQGVDGYDVGRDGLGQNFFGDEHPNFEFAFWAALIIEIVATAVFLYVILGITDKRNPATAGAPVAIGLALAGIHFATMGFTGTSVNPARSIGVGVFAGTDAIIQLWLFIVAPLLGAAIAGFTYALIFGRDEDPVPGSGLNFGGTAQPAAAGAGWQAGPQHQQHGWDPQAPQHGWDPNAQGQQQWSAGDQQAQPGQQWGQPAEQQGWDPNAQAHPQQGWDPNAQAQQPPQQQWDQQPPQQQWEQQPPPEQQGWETGEPDDGSRTQIRPPDQPNP